MIGTQLLHYSVTDKLGEGGMGEVYRARDTRLGRDVAIKVLPEAFVADAERLARFEREAQLLASLNHPNIGAIYGLEEAEGERFLVLELIEGETLRELIRQRVPLERALEIAGQIARALEAAHERGIVHRDLKPANVKVTPEGTVKVLDFGLAKAWSASPGDVQLSASPTLTAQMTQAGVILGTAAYMSPEQARGREVDKRADIWAFGVLVHEMLTGEGLFGADTVTDTLAAVVRAEPDWEALPRRLPRRCRRILERCLEKDPQLRLRDIGEARIAFDGAEPESPEDSVAQVAAAAPARAARLPWTVAGIALFAAILAATGTFPPRPEPPHPILRFKGEIAAGVTLDDEWPHVAFTPDGRTITFTGEGENGRALYVRDLDSLEARAFSGTAGAQHPFFSPDGEWIAYFDGGRLRKVSIRGGAPLTLAEGATQDRGGSWGADGYIYYTPTTVTGLWRVPAEGGAAEQLTTPRVEPPAERSHRWPQILPDGSGILFTLQPRGSSFDGANLAVLDLATGELEVVHRGGSYGRYLPSGHLLFVREGTLYAAPFDLAKREVVRSPAPVLEGVVYASGYGAPDLAVSPDGTLLYVPGGIADLAALEVLRVDAEGETQPLASERRAYRTPRFSPDGRTLLVSIDDDSKSEIWSLDPARDVLTRLTFAEGGSFAPEWSPDGTRFAFASRQGGQANIWWMPADGTGEPQRLTESDLGQVPIAWSPDGGALLFFQVGTSADIMQLDLESGEVEPYIDSDFDEIRPYFSPDGRWVAYESDESGGEEVYIRPFPLAAGKWRVSRAGGQEPVWSPDGRAVYYRGADRQVYAVDVREEGPGLRIGTPRALFEDRFGRFLGRNYDVAPDGSFVFLLGEEEAQREAELPVTILNWFEELERLVPLER